jgi:hypothetical protein
MSLTHLEGRVEHGGDVLGAAQPDLGHHLRQLFLFLLLDCWIEGMVGGYNTTTPQARVQSDTCILYICATHLPCIGVLQQVPAEGKQAQGQVVHQGGVVQRDVRVLLLCEVMG